MSRFRLVQTAVLFMLACTGDERPPRIDTPWTPQDAGVDADGSSLVDVKFNDGPPPPDASGYCGNQFFQVIQQPPNLYFVLDRSGSMLEVSAPGSWKTKYDAVREASIDVVVALGSRVKVGAAVFPGSPLVDECSTGKEVFSTEQGDMPGTFDGGTGPVAKAFAAATDVTPKGGTPTAATLAALNGTLRGLVGKTAVILATDGGPNCSSAHACGPADCIWNIEGAKLYDEWCTDDYNCCAEDIVGPGRLGCLDGAATVAAVAALRDEGVRTFVVGIPGSELFSSLLDQLATVGGSARAGTPKYYQVTDASSLGDTLMTIGEKIAITCDFELDSPPPDPDMVNVYLDGQTVPYDEENGWSWTGETSLSLNGAACETLESGGVTQVQVVAGCPTQQPR